MTHSLNLIILSIAVPIFTNQNQFYRLRLKFSSFGHLLSVTSVLSHLSFFVAIPFISDFLCHFSFITWIVLSLMEFHMTFLATYPLTNGFFCCWTFLTWLFIPPFRFILASLVAFHFSHELFFTTLPFHLVILPAFIFLLIFLSPFMLPKFYTALFFHL